MATPPVVPNPGPSFTTPNVYIGIVPYADVTFADAYFAERVDCDEWTDLPDSPTKLKYLKSATKWLDMLVWIGRRTDLYQKQAWPRNGNTDIPQEISEACCEIALAVLNGYTLEAMLEKVGITAESVGQASTSYESGGASRLLELNYGLPSAEAARLCAPWLEDTDVIRLERVS